MRSVCRLCIPPSCPNRDAHREFAAIPVVATSAPNTPLLNVSVLRLDTRCEDLSPTRVQESFPQPGTFAGAKPQGRRCLSTAFEIVHHLAILDIGVACKMCR